MSNPDDMDEFITLLEETGAEISDAELASMKRLCTIIPESQRCKMTHASELFLALEKRKVISPTNTSYLYKVLELRSVGRAKLAAKLKKFSETRRELLHVTQDTAQSTSSHPKPIMTGSLLKTRKRQYTDEEPEQKMKKPKLTAFRKLLKEISDDLCPDEVEEMKNLLLDEQLSRQDEHMFTTGMKLFLYLEGAGYISNTNVELLKELLTSINRQPLVDRLQNTCH
uniref:Uncharacterized protein LOC102801509 n=1 Tax=Saccoglossus kowalevskii TaxID=10224 RepID=A0ABM0MV16_SACKO|nr:PREDICTED: uncharacterized protein LOC102801509 [Saccoglossus kowalevskii]